MTIGFGPATAKRRAAAGLRRTLDYAMRDRLPRCSEASARLRKATAPRDAADRRAASATRLLVQRHHALRIDLQIANAVLRRRVRAEELGAAAATRLLHHLLPQRDGGARVVARARGDLDADAVGLGFVKPAVRQTEEGLVEDVAEVGAGLSGAEQHRGTGDQHL